VDYLHTEPLSKLVILPMDGSPPIICLKCGSYLVWSAQTHLVYRTPTCVCHTEEQCVCHTERQLVSPCHKSFARQTVLASVAPLHPPTPKREAPIPGGIQRRRRQRLIPRSALQPTPGPPGTRKPADSRASHSGTRRPRTQPGAAAHRRKRHEVLTHMPVVAAKAPGASSIDGA
jgi:hypothetical protein